MDLNESLERCLCDYAAVEDLENISILLDLGADINHCQQCQGAPLYTAVEESKTEAIQFLLRNGAKVNKPDVFGVTILQYALLQGQMKEVKHLLLHGSDVQKSYQRERFNFFSEKKMVDFLIRRADEFNIQNTNYATVLQFAITYDEEMALKILRRGISCNLDAFNPHGRTLLALAVSRNSIQIAVALLDAGANIDKKSPSMWTPLHASILGETSDMVHLLLNRGASLKSNDHFTCLYTAVLKNIPEVVKWLLDFGADPNEQLPSGATALHIAVRVSREGEHHQHRIEILRYLLKFGADVNISDIHGHTPLFFAYERGHFDCVQVLLLKEGTSKICDMVLDTSSFKASTLLESILQNKVDVNIRKNNNLTPLHLAASRSDNNTLKTLITYQGNVTLRDSEGSSVLQKAFSVLREQSEEAAFPEILKTVKLIASMVAVSETEGYSVGEDDQNILNENVLCSYYQQCKVEITEMKKKKIYGESNVRYYDFLTKNLSKLSNFMKDSSIMVSMKCGSYKDEFPIYGWLIERYVKLAECRANMFQMSEIFFMKCIKDIESLKLPYDVTEDIFKSFSDEELVDFLICMSKV